MAKPEKPSSPAEKNKQSVGSTTGSPSTRPPEGGWLRAVRQELGLTQSTVAKTAGLTQQAYAQFEQGEAKGTLSLGNLRRSADAMDCDLVYFLVPRGQPAPAVADLAAVRAPEPDREEVDARPQAPARPPASGDHAPTITLDLVQDHHLL